MPHVRMGYNYKKKKGNNIMVTSVTLSTGTTVKIPIFAAIPAGTTDIVKQSRAYGVFRDINIAGHVTMDLLTQAEIVEFYNMIAGGGATSFDTSLPSAPGNYHLCACFAWFYDTTYSAYRLAIGMRSNVQGVVSYQYTAFGSTSGLSPAINYYDGYNRGNTPSTKPQFPYETFSEFIDGSVYTQSLLNIRPGYIYTLEYAGKGDTIYTFGFGSNLSESDVLYNVQNYTDAHPETSYDENDNPYDNPYGITISEPGGGDGDIDLDPDEVDKAEIPDLPTVSAVDAGLITMYNCTAGQLQVLGSYLWSNAYDLETNFTKLFASPMDAIIGLSIIPVTPTLGSAATVKFGNIDTHISMSKLASQFVEKDMGSVSVKKWIGSFMDYSPYVKLSLYLPYIGYREINPDDVVGDTIHVVYHIDCLSGGCCAMVETSNKGLLYSFDGSCIANVPINALNYSGAIQNAISAVSGGVATVAGLATGNPVAAVGGAASVAQNVTNIKPSVQRSGQMSGAAGLMSYQKPMLIIERPNMCVPENLNGYTGNMLYVSRKLSQCKGFTQVSMIHLNGIPAMEQEKQELEALLKKGVIF